MTARAGGAERRLVVDDHHGDAFRRLFGHRVPLIAS